MPLREVARPPCPTVASRLGVCLPAGPRGRKASRTGAGTAARTRGNAPETGTRGDLSGRDTLPLLPAPATGRLLPPTAAHGGLAWLWSMCYFHHRYTALCPLPPAEKSHHKINSLSLKFPIDRDAQWSRASFNPELCGGSAPHEFLIR